MPLGPTVLLTGASGVVGSALLPQLSDCHVIALIHRTPAPGADEQLVGDLTAPLLGLDQDAYQRLCSRVDAVVHCAAITGFSSGPEATHALNAAGTRQMVELTTDADAVMYHVSTAFVDRTDLTRAQMGQDHGDATARPEDYLDSKRAGEDIVRSSGIPAVIVRPSVVIGDAATGAISAFQGMHGVIHGLLRGLLPLVPVPAHSPVDFVPQDVVAATIARLIRQGTRDGEVWVTAGTDALRTDRALEVIQETADRLGLDAARPRIVGPEMVDRLIRPVFIANLHPRARRRFDDMLAMTALFAHGHVFPNSLGQKGLPAALSSSGLESALRTSVTYMARAKGMVRTAPTADLQTAQVVA
ncbi:SDR family oxidoreductase [Streptomyces microflavus]|uniref:SDR family oxidoreductase n=1 Tax=Streptomyces TaxID=1883 RepID=UPI00068EA260|nr:MULTISPECIES: SDR family oxidoreductase [Streptomyces]MDX2977339.1 SDR family oxidoreductase [Streptomyces sp. NRRL_B-2249]GGX79440.1 ketoreductase [Streptomyces microflavus]